MWRFLVALGLAGLLGAQQVDVPYEAFALAQIKGRMQLSLLRIPDYACSQTIRRARLTKKAVERLEKQLERERKRNRNANIAFPLESTDVIQVELAYVDGKELYSWPGAEGFEDRTLAEMVGFGNLSTGNFASTAHNLFDSAAARFEFVGRESLDGRELLRYDYRVGLFQSRFTLVDAAGRSADVPYAGSIWAEPETFDLVRVETRAEEIPPQLEIVAATTRIDYRRMQVGDGSFLLPAGAEETTVFRSGAESRNQTSFENCRRFGVTSQISFGESEDPQAVGEELDEFDLPEGLDLAVRLTTPIDSEEAKIGDLVVGVLEADVTRDGTPLAPKGAEVRGRIRRLERYQDPEPYFTLGIELTELRFDRGRARFDARMLEVSPMPGMEFGRPSATQRTSEETLSFGGVPGRLRRYQVETYEDLNLPGVGVISIRGSRFRLEPGLRMRWETIGR